MMLDLFMYILAMAVTTYLIRMLPFTLFRKKLTSSFAKSFFAYIPYAVLAAMTFPGAFYATGSFYTALAGVVTAIVLTLCNRSLIVVALGACLATYLTGLLPL